MECRSKAFISHSSMDKEFAWKLVKTLNSYQLPVWFDARELKPGDHLENSIKAGIKEADFFIIRP